MIIHSSLPSVDEQDYFPGDFCVKGTSNVFNHRKSISFMVTHTRVTSKHVSFILITGESSSVSNVYGVVQKSDHRERTCRVQWFRPYIPGKGEQKPADLEVAECSVYDIKDHPGMQC